MTFLEEEFDQLDAASRRRFFSRLCEVGECDRKLLATALDLRPSDLKAIESASAKLPFWAKSALLENFDATEVTSAIESAIGGSPEPM